MKLFPLLDELKLLYLVVSHDVLYKLLSNGGATWIGILLLYMNDKEKHTVKRKKGEKMMNLRIT